MIHNEQAYEDLGLSVDANRQLVERRYHIVIRRLHAKQLRGTLSMMDEVQLKSVNQAYQFIIKEENNKLIEEYRQKHYGKYRRYSRLAEKIDHILFYYMFQIVACTLLLLFSIFTVLGIRHYQHEQQILANLPVPDLSIMIDVDDLPNLEFASEHALEQRLLPLVPGWKHIDNKYNLSGTNNSLVLTENPDLYILNREQFIILLRLGYLRKLEEWNAYGVNLGTGKLSDLINVSEKPLIAAVSVYAKRPENAMRFIHRFYDDAQIEVEAMKVTENKK